MFGHFAEKAVKINIRDKYKGFYIVSEANKPTEAGETLEAPKNRKTKHKMEEEITPSAATNGVARNAEEGTLVATVTAEMEVDAVVSTSVWEENNAVERVNDGAEEEEQAVADDIVVYMNEGDAVPNTVGEVEAEKEAKETGHAEYLEDEMPENDGEDKSESTAVNDEAATADNSNANNVQAEETPTATTETAVVEEAADNVTTAAEGVEADVEEEAEGEEEEEVVEEEEEEEEDEEAELITGDDAQEQPKTAEEQSDQANVSARLGAKQEEPVDENQCRVCTSKDNLVSLFTKNSDATTPADMLLLICPNVSIAPKDFMPQFICNSCQQSLTIAIQLRKQLETTDRDLRKRLSRSKNKVRRPRGYVVIDAPVSDSASDNDEESDDVEFKVSDVAGSTSADSDSADSDISEKRKPGRRRGRKKKRATGSEEEAPQKKRSLQTPPASAAQGPFECDQCDQSFPRKQSYIMHRKTHESRYEYHCQICNKKFKVRGAYKTHMERHEAERAQFRCELCSQVFRLRAELKRHMAVRHDEHGVIYECKRCQRTFLTQQRLQRHQATSCMRHAEQKVRRPTNEGYPRQGQDLFKSVAPLTTTYWSDSFSD